MSEYDITLKIQADDMEEAKNAAAAMVTTTEVIGLEIIEVRKGYPDESSGTREASGQPSRCSWWPYRSSSTPGTTVTSREPSMTHGRPLTRCV